MVVMKFLFAIATTLHFTSIASKKLDISSEESIENILFYKDFRPKKQELAPLPPERLVLPAQPKQPECIPRMCCSMSCTNSCGQNEIGPDSLQRSQPTNYMNPGNSNPFRPMNSMNSLNSINPMNPMNPMNSINSMNSMNSMNHFNSIGPRNPMPTMPPMPQQKPIPQFMKQPKKKKQPPVPLHTRRDSGNAREHIKSLISQDEDIKKILKDLVKVTMKKVDLLEMIKARRAVASGNFGLNNGDDDEEEL
ncbi:sporozoite surface protein 2-like [Cydia fagiglandana]|uniref:sporozoite surface protein 2-like n=1 Tax=Cydia fagiglandana TaxID=1458189 RepID=UPI002FEE0D54